MDSFCLSQDGQFLFVTGWTVFVCHRMDIVVKTIPRISKSIIRYPLIDSHEDDELETTIGWTFPEETIELSNSSDTFVGLDTSIFTMLFTMLFTSGDSIFTELFTTSPSFQVFTTSSNFFLQKPLLFYNVMYFFFLTLQVFPIFQYLHFTPHKYS